MDAAGLAALAALLADGTRAAVCTNLLDGRAWTAGELARAIGVAPSTMSEHLGRLLDGGLLVERRQGRHRYVALAGPEVAAVLEALAELVEPARPVRTLRAVRADAGLRSGRTCYDHLAGRLGVAITEAMADRGLLDAEAGLAVTTAGFQWFADELSIELRPGPGAVAEGAAGRRRPLSRACLDWTERRPHLAGVAGAHLCTALLDRGWIGRTGTGRAVVTTPAGDVALGRLLGIRPADSPVGPPG